MSYVMSIHLLVFQKKKVHSCYAILIILECKCLIYILRESTITYGTTIIIRDEYAQP